MKPQKNPTKNFLKTWEKIKDYGKVFKDVKNTRIKQKFLEGIEKGIETFIDMKILLDIRDIHLKKCVKEKDYKNNVKS